MTGTSLQEAHSGLSSQKKGRDDLLQAGERFVQFCLVERDVHRDVQVDRDGLLDRHDHLKVNGQICPRRQDDIRRGIVYGKTASVEGDPCAVDGGRLAQRDHGILADGQVEIDRDLVGDCDGGFDAGFVHLDEIGI